MKPCEEQLEELEAENERLRLWMKEACGRVDELTEKLRTARAKALWSLSSRMSEVASRYRRSPYYRRKFLRRARILHHWGNCIAEGWEP